MDSRDNLDILLGIDGEHPYPEWDILKEIDRRDMRNSARKEANRRAHRNSATVVVYRQKYDREVVSPRRKATRRWMKEHPKETEEIRSRHEEQKV